MRRARPILISTCCMLILSLFGGCAEWAVRQQPDKRSDHPKPGYLRRAVVGVGVRFPNEPQLQVVDFTDGLTAEQSGIQKDDIIRAVDGKHINNLRQLFRILEAKLPGDSVLVTVERNGQTLDCDIILAYQDVPALWHSLISVVLDEIEKGAIRVAVIPGEFTNLRIKEGSELDQYKRSAKTATLSEFEEILLKYFGKDDRFFLVDRNRVEEILNEFEFGQSGFISEDLRARLGKMLGVTHLLIPSHVTWANGATLYVKLIDIETGRVLLSSDLPE